MNNIYGSVPKITRGGSVIRGSLCRLLDAGISADGLVKLEMAMQDKEGGWRRPQVGIRTKVIWCNSSLFAYHPR